MGLFFCGVKHIDHSDNIAYYARKEMQRYEEFILSFMLFIFAISASFGLPNIQIDMMNPKRYNLLVYVSHFLIAAFYLVIGALGYWIYGDLTNVVILTNFFEYPGFFLFAPPPPPFLPSSGFLDLIGCAGGPLL